MRCGSGGSSPGSSPRSPRRTGSSRSWSFTRRAPGPAWGRRASPSSFWPRIGRAGTGSSCNAVSRPSRAEALARPLGPYALQAAIAACHSRAGTAEETDWKRIVALYDALVEVTQSPVVALNRAVAVSMAFGPAAGLELVDELVKEPALRGYHLLPSVRGDLLAKLGRTEDARIELERAAFMAKNTRERELLLARAKACK
jgi:predicted RNA polymerase sigma factor